MSRNDNHLCGLTLYAETCSLAEGHAGACDDGTSERPALLRDRDALVAVAKAAQRWAVKEVAWDPDGPDTAPKCDPATCGVPHDCLNEYDAADDHLKASVAALASPSGGGA